MGARKKSERERGKREREEREGRKEDVRETEEPRMIGLRAESAPRRMMRLNEAKVE